MHLSSNKRIILMGVYSIITFFITPLITSPFLHNTWDKCTIGFFIGFLICIIHWNEIGTYI